MSTTSRRAFLTTTALGLLAASRPLRGVAGPPRLGAVFAVGNENLDALIEGLRRLGYVDGQNIALDVKIYGQEVERLPGQMRELLTAGAAVIFGAGPYAIRAAVKAAPHVPIVGLDLESDPIASGWAQSLARPGRNFTGLFLDLPEMSGKQIELLKEMVPGLSRALVVWDSSIGEVQFHATEIAARTTGIGIESLPIQRTTDLKPAFDRAARDRRHGAIVLSSPLILARRAEIVSLARQARLPTISLFTSFPLSGGLLAYGPDLLDMFRQSATYVDRILRGANPGELPIERPKRFELVINRETADVLGLSPPQALLLRADRVIE